jgi:integrase/recombinase XerD
LDKEVSVNFSPGNKRRRLPTVLSKKQISKIINIPTNLKHRLLLMTTYAAGLRASEVKLLKPEHINSERMLIKVENGIPNPLAQLSGHHLHR